MREKIKPLPTSSKPTVDNVGGNSQNKIILRCSTKEKPCEHIMAASNSRINDRSNGKKHAPNLNKDQSFECKVEAVPRVCSKIRTAKKIFAEEGARVSSLVRQVKPEIPLDDKTSTTVCAASSDNHGHMKAEEASGGGRKFFEVGQTLKYK